MSLLDLAKRIEQDEVMLAKEVRLVDGDKIVLNGWYDVKLSRCDTAPKLLHWLHHLTEKSWMTNEVMRRFIEVACRANNIEMEDA